MTKKKHILMVLFIINYIFVIMSLDVDTFSIKFK